MAKAATLIRTGGVLTWEEYKNTLIEWGLLKADGSNLKDNGDGIYTITIEGIPFVINTNELDFPIYDPDDPYVKPPIKKTEPEDLPTP